MGLNLFSGSAENSNRSLTVHGGRMDFQIDVIFLVFHLVNILNLLLEFLLHSSPVKIQHWFHACSIRPLQWGLCKLSGLNTWHRLFFPSALHVSVQGLKIFLSKAMSGCRQEKGERLMNLPCFVLNYNFSVVY